MCARFLIASLSSWAVYYLLLFFVCTDLVEVRRMDFEKNVKGRHINCRRKENWRHSYEESQVFKIGFDWNLFWSLKLICKVLEIEQKCDWPSNLGEGKSQILLNIRFLIFVKPSNVTFWILDWLLNIIYRCLKKIVHIL